MKRGAVVRRTRTRTRTRKRKRRGERRGRGGGEEGGEEAGFYLGFIDWGRRRGPRASWGGLGGPPGNLLK